MSFPFLPGVPPLLAPYVGAAAVLISGPLARFLDRFRQTWGIYDVDGNQVIVPDNVAGIEHALSYNVASYPVEKGSFASYNKVKVPRSVSVTMTKGGSKADMDDFLKSVESIVSSLSLYVVTTPNASYQNMNAVKYSYRRETKNGAGIIKVEIYFLEIRQATVTYSSSASLVPNASRSSSSTSLGLPSDTGTVPSAQKLVNGGTLYPSTSTATVTGVQ